MSQNMPISATSRIPLIFAVLILSALLVTCSGGGGGTGAAQSSRNAAGTASLLLYATDDLSSYLQVIATITRVRLVNTSSAATCEALSSPVTLDIANLANVMQLSTLSTCPATNYNRIDLEFAQDVQLMDGAENTSSCRFASYLNDADQPLSLSCDATTGVCALEILGAVRSGSFDLLTTQVNKLALDFDLKKFTVQNFGDAANCSLAMKVLQLHEAEIIQRGSPEALSGSISKLDTAARTFTVANNGVNTLVNYAAVANADHPGIDALLQAAQDNGISVMVTSANLGGVNTTTIAASEIAVKLAGTVSSLVKAKSDYTFTLTYDSTRTMQVLSAPPLGKKHGNLVDGAWADVQFYGFDSVQGMYLSSLVSVQKPGTVTGN